VLLRAREQAARLLQAQGQHGTTRLFQHRLITRH
jgi:hypothetical protein